MKKLFFSGVALVAFSCVSMANTVAVDEIAALSNIENTKTVKVGDVEDCYENASYFLDYIDPHGDLDDVTANVIYQAWFASCMDFRKKPGLF